MSSTDTLTHDVFINEPPPQENGALPNGEPRSFPPLASTLISGAEDAVLVDPGFTTDQARALGDWVASKERNVTDIFITHGHGDHWYAADSWPSGSAHASWQPRERSARCTPTSPLGRSSGTRSTRASRRPRSPR